MEKIHKEKKKRSHIFCFRDFLIDFAFFLVVFFIICFIAEVCARAVLKYSPEGGTAVNLKIFEASDVYGWGHNPGSVANNININSFGFRDDEVTLTKSEGTKRILVLGDSFTFGMSVKKPEVYTEVLEKMLNERNDGTTYEVINGGAIGYTTDNEYLLLNEKGLTLNPDIVVLAFFAGNDVTEIRRHLWETDENGVPLKLTDTDHYVDEDHRLRLKGEEEPVSYFVNFIYKRMIILEQKFGWIKTDPTLTWPAFLDPNDPNGDPRIPLFWDKIEIVISAMKHELDNRNIKLIVVSIPMDVQTDKKYWKKYSLMYFDDDAYEKNRPQTKLKELTDKYGIDLIELLPYFREEGKDKWLYFEKEDPHWTSEGHALAAQIIYDNLQL
jgi:hypothetical protein